MWWIDIVPVETDAGFDEQAVGEGPTIFGVGADFGVELLVHLSAAEGGVAGAGEGAVLRGVEASHACG